MVHTLSALQMNKDILLNTMDVFVKEPLLDWEKLARRLAATQGGGGDEKNTWFPKKKIEIAKRKLELDNPAYVSLTELSESIHQNKKYLPFLKKILMGSEENVRARAKKKCESAKEQVDCLVDQATDPNILARAWGGWAPWV
eukprot:TRINITY_DN9091_c0_g1_i1.p1 TRINITY_DN9091_c0_g1~~TRINITY_DN9091_c0_g1_i1.p1  ORF type:complete len:142 (-),score=35.51 TRINITY_DN9091_c0_g1_i1:42-467(-)